MILDYSSSLRSQAYTTHSLVDLDNYRTHALSITCRWVEGRKPKYCWLDKKKKKYGIQKCMSHKLKKYFEKYSFNFAILYPILYFLGQFRLVPHKTMGLKLALE